jgi:hypothetical protein
MSEQAQKVIRLANEVTRGLEDTARAMADLTLALPRNSVDLSIPECVALMEQIPRMEAAQALLQAAGVLLRSRMGAAV